MRLCSKPRALHATKSQACTADGVSVQHKRTLFDSAGVHEVLQRHDELGVGRSGGACPLGRRLRRCLVLLAFDVVVVLLICRAALSGLGHWLRCRASCCCPPAALLAPAFLAAAAALASARAAANSALSAWMVAGSLLWRSMTSGATQRSDLRAERRCGLSMV